MKLHHASTPAPEPATYNGAQFEAPVHMTKAWARVTLLVTVGVLALGFGIAGAVYISPVALGAGAIVALPFLVFGGIMAAYTRATHRMIYPAAPKPQPVTPRAAAPEEAGHIVNVAGRPMVLPNLSTPIDKPAPVLVGFPVCTNDVLYVLERSWREGTAFRTWEGHKLPSGVKLDRGSWTAMLDGLLRWNFATERQVDGKRKVELRQDIGVDDMMTAVREGAKE